MPGMRIRPTELLPEGTVCGKCGGSDFRQEFDILDVWFDSGSSHLATLGRGRICPGLPICTSKAAISIAAGSRVRC